jgi:nucleotide-binding universal stress UspA family protein
MTTYLCGYDGTPAAQRAVELARRLAAAAEGHALAMWVRDLTQSGQRGRFAPADATVAGTSVPLHTVLAASPSSALRDAAVRLNAAMLVVGASTHGGVVQSLLHGAPCPVLVVPQDARLELERVGVAYDAQPYSDPALAAAGRLAAMMRARLVVLTALDARHGLPGPDAVDALKPELANWLEVVAGIPDPAERVEVRLLAGEPAPALAEAARELVDVLVTGSRRFGSVRGVLPGSVSRALAERAPCPVLVVPHEPTGPATADSDAFGYPSVVEGLFGP